MKVIDDYDDVGVDVGGYTPNSMVEQKDIDKNHHEKIQPWLANHPMEVVFLLDMPYYYYTLYSVQPLIRLIFLFLLLSCR